MKNPPSTRDPPTRRVTVVVPAKDEEAAIGDTLRSLPRATFAAMGFEAETVILDGHSRDGTRDIVYRHGGATVVFDRQRGKARAMINARPLLRGDFILMMDADGTYAPDALPRVLHKLAYGASDVVMGCRQIQDGAMTGCHRVGNALLSWMAEILYLHRCPDVCTGLWGFRAAALHSLPLRSQRFELEAEMFALSTRKGLRISYVPVDYLPRKGVTKLSTADALRIAWWLMKSRVCALDDAPPQSRNSNVSRPRPRGGIQA